MNAIPEKVTAFNVYNEGERLVGVSGEVEIPSIEQMTSTISGAGILGEIDVANIGHVGALKIAIPFRALNAEATKLFEPRSQTITLRANQSSHDVSTGTIIDKPLKIVVRGMPASFKTGKLSAGNPTDSEVELEIYYIKIEFAGAVLVELDKLNFIFVVNGKDWLAKVRENI